MRRFNPFTVSFRTLLASAALAGAVLAAGCGGDEPKPRVSRLPDVPVAHIPPDAAVPMVVTPPTVVTPPIVVKAPIDIPATYAECVTLAKKLAKDKNLDDALDVWLAASKLDPAKAEPKLEIARIYLGKGDARSARKFAESAVELAPESSSAWNTMGRVELMDKDHDAAIDDFGKATELNEDNVWAWNNLGLALSEAGRWDDAVIALEHVIDSEQVEAYMFNNLGVAYERSGRLEEARATYKAGAKKNCDACKVAITRLDGKDQHTASADPSAPAPDTVPAPTPEPVPAPAPEIK